MTRLVLLSVVALGLAACGGPSDDAWSVEADGPEGSLQFDEMMRSASPAQQLMVLLTGGAVGSSPGPMAGRHSTRESSPDPMPGKPKDDGGTNVGGSRGSNNDGTGRYR